MPVFFVGGVVGAYIAFFTFGSLFSGLAGFCVGGLSFIILYLVFFFICQHKNY